MSAGTRRAFIFTASLGTVAFAALQMHRLVDANGLTGAEYLWYGLFLLSFAWISLSFWTQLAGFVSRALSLRLPGLSWPDAAARAAPLKSRAAILLPVFNEDPVVLFAGVRAMLGSLERTGQAEAFDFFVLSDSNDAEAWVLEEREWARLCADVGQGRVYYRRRTRNTGKKAGNIAEFCRTWGSAYELMAVLDADSLMEGETLVTMARLMEANPGAGIIQAPPVAVEARTAFARLQQFASRMYGGQNASGLAYWQCGESNYWGHNAMLRVQAFMDHCGLPVLSGAPPFGGHILSHDFVEAALIRRAGYSVWLVPELGGSYERLPPNLLDYAARDRRWCQGNLQHGRLVFADRLHWMSRLHFILGISAYASSAVCSGFLAVGGWLLVKSLTTQPRYFADGRTLFPTWQTFDYALAIQLGVMSLGLLLLPKVFALLLTYARREERVGFGGALRVTVSVVLETAWAALIAPATMLFHTVFVIAALFGHKVEWNAQPRDERAVSWQEAFERHGGHTLLGAAVLVGVYVSAPSLLPWLSLFITGLLLSAPLTVVSSSARLGLLLRKLGLFVIPEEQRPPEILELASRHLATRNAELAAEQDPTPAWLRVVREPARNALHVSVLRPAPLEPATRALSLEASTLIRQGNAAAVTPSQRLALLEDATVLTELHEALLGSHLERTGA